MIEQTITQSLEESAARSQPGATTTGRAKGTWCLRDIAMAFVDSGVLTQTFAVDLMTAIATQHLGNGRYTALTDGDLDRPMPANSKSQIFPFLAKQNEKKSQSSDSFRGQAKLTQIYGKGSFTEQRLRLLATKLFTQISRNFATAEEAFLTYSRAERRSHALVNLCFSGLDHTVCDSSWQETFLAFLDRMLQVGRVEYSSRRLDVAALEREYRLHKSGKQHILYLLDDNAADKDRAFGTIRSRPIVKGPNSFKSKPSLYGWQGKTIEAFQDPDTGLTAYQDKMHPLSVPSLATNEHAFLNRPVHVNQEDMLDMWAGRVGQSSTELFDKSVACGIVTESTDTSPRPEIEAFKDTIVSNLAWARAHLRYGGTLVVPAPDFDPLARVGEEAEPREQGSPMIRHSLGRLLPKQYKEVLQSELDKILLKACDDSVSCHDRRSWLPRYSP